MEIVTAPRVRHAEVHFGDTLQRLALRELGDASRWVELVVINGLRPPYIVPPDQVGAGLLGYGDFIKIPAPGAIASASVDAERVLGRDLLLKDGQLVASDGDLSLVGGIDNYTQAIRNRVSVNKRELAFHPEYGCFVRTVMGAKGGRRSAQLAAFYVRSSILEDPRSESVLSCVAQIDGDKAGVAAKVKPISGQSTDLTLQT